MEAVDLQFTPETGTEEEWNEAYARLADYFRSYQLHDRIRRTQLILENTASCRCRPQAGAAAHAHSSQHRAGAADAEGVARSHLQRHESE